MAKNGKEYELLIKIAGNVEKSLDSSLKSVEKSVKGFKGSMNEINGQFTQMDKGFDKIMKAGKKAFDALVTGATVAAGAIGAVTMAAVNTGIEFESAFAGVKKTVDATEEEFDRLRNGILEMSRTIPESASAIAGVMEIAGQLGIANDSLLDFTETMINLGVSTNMSAEDAATALAKFANIVNMEDYDKDGVSNWERLGSTVVDLGNKFATTEEDIVNMSMRLASTGHLAGLSEADILGLSTAMSAVGIRAEAGGSAMAKLLKKIQVAVETGSESLEDYAKVANMSSDEFSKAFQDNAVGALTAFIDGLNDTERNGASAIAVLDEMGLKEVRLSNMILALAGSEGVMTDAVKIANEAWGENVALTEEAEKRYETVESQVTLVKNALQELGIQAYDEMRPYIVDALSAVKDKLHELIDSGKVKDFIKKVGDFLPTLKRNFDTYAMPVINKGGDVLKWIFDHGDKIVSVIAGIAGGLAAYKIASDTVHFITALTNFIPVLMANPVLGVILGIVGAIGALIGVITELKIQESELTQMSLEEHFGNITLSMKDLKDIAEYLVNSDTLTKAREALSEFSKLDGIADQIDDAVETLNRLNFKVEIGMELDEDDQESYKAAIDTYIKNMQEYALQEQFAVTLNIKALIPEDVLEDTNLLERLNTFYGGKSGELAQLGSQLNKAVTDAFKDGFLDFDETQVISNLQSKMQAVQRTLATNKMEGTLAFLQQGALSGGQLTADSFMNLIDQANQAVESANADLQESYAYDYAAIANLRDQEIKNAEVMVQDMGTRQAMIDEANKDYKESMEALNQTLLDTKTQQTLKVFDTVGMDTIKQQYESEFGDTMDQIKPFIQEKMKELINVDAALAGEDVNFGQAIHELYYAIQDEFGGVLGENGGAVEQLLEALAPTEAQMEALAQDYRNAGKEIPQSILDGIMEFQTLGLMATGEGDDIWSLIGEACANDEQLTALMTTLNEKGYQIPEEIKTAVIENVPAAQEGVSVLYNETSGMVNSLFGAGMSVDFPVTINIIPNVVGGDIDVGSYVNISGGGGGGSSNAPAGGTTHASGGIVNFKTMSWLAEDGPEAVIPLDGSDNAMSLWAQAGKLLGIGDDDNAVSNANAGIEMVDTGGSMDITYSPQFIFNGDAPSKQDMVDAAAMSQKQFDQMMQEWQKKNRRTKFAS